MPQPADSGLPNPISYDSASIDGVVIDQVTGLIWQRFPPATSYALPLPAGICSDLRLADAGDWRVPTMIELFSLIDYSLESPDSLIDPEAFPPLTPDGGEDGYWSSTPVAGAADSGSLVGPEGWALVFGTMNYRAADSAFHVRCVRGSRSPTLIPATRYSIDGGVVHDNFSGLDWQQDMSSEMGQAYVWGSADAGGTAQGFCAQLSLAGGGWRVPDLKSLASLVDMSVPNLTTNQAAFDPEAFPNSPSGFSYWSSTQAVAEPGSVWIVDYDGSTGTEGETDVPEGKVRCSRP